MTIRKGDRVRGHVVLGSRAMTDARFVELMAHTPPTEGANGIVLAVHERDRLVALAREGVKLRDWIDTYVQARRG